MSSYDNAGGASAVPLCPASATRGRPWNRPYPLACGLALLGLLMCLVPQCGWAAGYGSVSGIVHDSAGRPVAGAQAVLESAAHALTQQTTDSMGRFDFPKVEIGRYLLTVSRKGFDGSRQAVTVEAGYFPFAQILLSRPSELSPVTVTANREVVASVTPITLVSQEAIQNTPGASTVNSLAMITDYVPGAYEAHDMLHMRGGHQTDWLVDGVEIPNTNIAENIGPELDPQDIETAEIDRGSYSADEGDRTYGIFNIIPKSGFGATDQAELDVTAGNFGQTDDYASLASHSSDLAYYASIEGNRSNLGLQTPTSEVIHDASQGYGAFTNVQYSATRLDSLNFVAQLRQDTYQIPDCTGPPAEDPGCIGLSGDVQGEADNFALLSWTHTFTTDAVLTSSVMYHFERAAYDAGAADYPTISTYHHSSQYEGAEEELRMSFTRNHLDVGVFGFAQQDEAEFNVVFTDNSSPALQELQRPSGGLIAAWVQDTFEAAHWLNLSAGVRLSHFQGNLTEEAADPRLGATVLLPRLHWVLSAFWGTYYQAPPLETLSGPLVAYASANDTAFLPLHGERDSERQFGLTIPLKGWSIQVDNFMTQATDFFDHNPIGESNIFLPLTDQGATIKGTELTVRSPAFWRLGQVHLSYSNQSADCFGSITGGLVEADAGCGFPPTALDHDQRNTLNVGYNGNLPRRFFVGSNLSYNSGLSNAFGPPSHLPGYTIFDLTIGRQVTSDLSLSVTALNLTNRHLLTDNSLTFGGLHWNNPFQIYAEARYRFHY
ncbi:MAG TPA: TonB-dependent receptor [Steroidobacteraceae bacterium]|nr:TonB-dependent receptor [Steroidobacteraceae bacterium]